MFAGFHSIPANVACALLQPGGTHVARGTFLVGTQTLALCVKITRGLMWWGPLLAMFHVSLATPTGPWRDQFARLQNAVEEPTDSDKGLVPLHVNLSAVDVGFGSGQDRRSRSPVKCFLKQRCAQQNGVALLVEVGVYLGQSVAEWLSSVQRQDCVHVVGIDPFTNPGNTTPPAPHKYPAGRLPTAIRNKLGVPAFNRALVKRVIEDKVGAHVANRQVALVTGFAPRGLQPLFDSQPLLPVDVVYIDGGKTGNTEKHKKYLLDSLALYSSHYPNAGISGDDWSHPETKALLQHVLVEWARNHSLALGVASGRTWFMGASEQAWGSCDRKKQIRWVVRGPP